MVRTLGLLAMLMFGFGVVFSQTPVTATLPGIKLVTQTAKTITYDIKINGMTDSAQARSLDSDLLAKYGILTAHTDFGTKVCRVEVLKKITESNLHDVIERAGLKVAKTFQE